MAELQAQVVDRIVVRIEDDILTLSEVRELGAFQQLTNGTGGASPDATPSEEELILRLINQWIVQAEATTMRFPRPAPEEVKRATGQLEKQFVSAEAYRAKLRELGLTRESVARQIERQLYLTRYLDYKFRPTAQIEREQVEKYYQQELTPELRKRGQAVPPVEEVEEQVRELLTQREISKRSALWLDETRSRLKIEFLGKGNVP